MVTYLSHLLDTLGGTTNPDLMQPLALGSNLFEVYAGCRYKFATLIQNAEREITITVLLIDEDSVFVQKSGSNFDLEVGVYLHHRFEGRLYKVMKVTAINGVHATIAILPVAILAD